MRRALCFLSLVFSLPTIVQAQHPGGVAMSGMHFAAGPAPMAAPRVASVHPMVSARHAGQPVRVGTRLPAPPRAAHPAGWNQGTRHNTTSVDPVFPNGNLAFNGYPVPGLGFDYPHFFATHPNAGRCRRCSGFGSGFVIPFIDGGFYLPTPFYGDQGAAQPAEEPGAPEQAASAEEPPTPDPSNYYPQPRAKALPVPAQQEYVFVKRDGTLIFAVAYSWINDRLQYVTEEGIRRTVPRNTLDLDATQQFNDQRGVPIQLPA